jgi:glycosyltransferase involved in cell wall biosynthesis
MKIIFIGHKIDKIVTGGQRRIVEILDYLAKKGIQIYYLRAPYTKNFILVNFYYIRLISKLNKNIKDMIILQDYSLRFYLFLFNFYLLLFLKRKKIISLANAFYFHYRNSRFKNLIDKIISILFFIPVDMVIASGQAAREQVLSLRVPANKIRIAYPALRKEFIESSFKPQACIFGQEITLLFVGRLHNAKGLNYLLEALSLIGTDGLKLRVVGDTKSYGNHSSQIFDLVQTLGIKNQIEFTGEVCNIETIIRIYREADIFVLPSVWDTAPVCLWEAMCMGLPIVATNVGGIPEFVEDNVNGFLVPPKNSKALKEAILKLIQEPGLRQEIGQRSFKKSFQFRQRTWEDVGKEYYQAFLELIEGFK